VRNASNRLQLSRSGRTDLAFGQKKVFKKPSFLGGFFIGVLIAGFPLAASAEEAMDIPLAQDRASLERMLKDLQLPPVTSYYSQTLPSLPPPVASPVMRQHDIEEIPRES
jgi:hypothetical protein